jgi:hypothetical protein
VIVAVWAWKTSKDSVMTRALPLALLLATALSGCGKKESDAPQKESKDPPVSGGVTPGKGTPGGITPNKGTPGGITPDNASPPGTPPPPTIQQKQDYLRVVGKLMITGSDIGDPANGFSGVSYELSESVTDADVLALRDPGYAFGLRLTSPKLTDKAVAACAKFPSLMSFSLNKAKGFTATGVAELAKMKHLRVLELTDMPVEDSWLAALRPLGELRRINLDNAYKVTDAGLAHLSGLTHLREINFHHTKVTGSGLGSLANAKGLHRVYLNEQSDAALIALAKIGKLHALEEALTAAEERPSSNADVSRFMIRGPVTDVGLKEVTAFPNMVHLHIESEKITAASLPFLKSLKKLKRLDAGFPISDEQREELKKALPGCEIR